MKSFHQQIHSHIVAVPVDASMLPAPTASAAVAKVHACSLHDAVHANAGTMHASVHACLKVLGVEAAATPEQMKTAFECRVTAACALSRDAARPRVSWLAAAYEHLLLQMQTSLDLPPRVPTEPNGRKVPAASSKYARIVSDRNLGRSSRNRIPAAMRSVNKILNRLQTLAPEYRRAVISDLLTQEQRLSLERLVLSNRIRPKGGHANPQAVESLDNVLTVNRLGAFISRAQLLASGGYAYQAEVHLGGNLYAMSASCRCASSAAASLAFLVQLRSRVRVLMGYSSRMEESVDGSSFLKALCEVMETGRAWGNTPDFRLPFTSGVVRTYFRSRLGFRGGLRLSTPQRSEIIKAMADWNELCCFTRSSKAHRPKMTRHWPDGALSEWTEALGAWFRIWSGETLRGNITIQKLELKRVAMDAVFKRSLLKARVQREAKQRVLAHQLVQALLHAEIQSKNKSGIKRKAGHLAFQSTTSN